MNKEETMSSNVNALKALIQLVEVHKKVDENDAKSILLKRLPPRYNTILFTVNNSPLQTLETVISSPKAVENHDTDDKNVGEIFFFDRGKSKSEKKE